MTIIINPIFYSIMTKFKAFSFAMFFIAFFGIATSCEKCECDEPEPTPTPTPTPTDTITINMNDIVIEPTSIFYGYEGYNDICIMVIKSTINDPTISVTPVHDHISTYVKKLSENPDDDGFYNYLVYANLSQNSTDSNRPFQIIAKAIIDSTTTGANSYTRSLDYTDTQLTKQIYEKDYDPFKFAIGKWILNNVRIINNNTGEYTSNSFIGSDKYLHLPGDLVIKKVEYNDAFGNPVVEDRAQCTSEKYTCSNLYGSGFIIPDGNGSWYAQLNDDNDGYLDFYSNDQSYRMKIIMINSTVMILEYTKDNTIYSYYFKKESE